MRSPSRHRPGKLREQMCGVAPLIACVAWRTAAMKTIDGNIGAFLPSASRKNYQSIFSSKATALPHLYRKAIEN